MKTLISGIKPTGIIHIGNYFGALKQWVALQDTYESTFFVADLHALTTVQDKHLLQTRSREMVKDLLAIGIAPGNIYIQSAFPEVTELTWYFNCITTVPYLSRAHAFKDAESKGKEVTVGVFDYPLLMAADILIHDAQCVPVGSDQKQHVEYARDAAEKFNRIFGETFILPEPYILKETGVVPGIDGQKMSKSYNNIIPLFATREEIQALVMKIPTDSRGPNEIKNPDELILYQIHKLFDSSEVLRNEYTQGLSYKEAKERLINAIDTYIAPLRDTRNALSDAAVDIALEQGRARIHTKIQGKIQAIRKSIGVV